MGFQLDSWVSNDHKDFDVIIMILMVIVMFVPSSGFSLRQLAVSISIAIAVGQFV